jgi:hypothetical protein
VSGPGAVLDTELAQVGNPPDGAVKLWFFVFATDGAFMGAAQVTRPPGWLWRDGRLCCDYSPVHVRMTHGGTYSTGLICAVSPDRQVYRPLWPLSLGKPGKLRAGDYLTVVDGIISLIPDLPGPHGLSIA